MPLSWNEIKSRAVTFSKKWENETSEDAEAKSFWDDFFNIFGISRYRVASFEKAVTKLDDKQGFIDLLWKGVILIEHKSRGKDLDKAFAQAKDYFPGLKEKELPRYILVCDFAKFRLYDLETNTQNEFTLAQLKDNVALFGSIAGYEKKTYKEQDPVNIEAAELMGKLHDKLKTIGYEGHQLELYLVRLVFCLFADDSNIFEKDIFNEYIELKTAEDGSDLARAIAELFEVLNTAEDKRLNNLDESLAAFPYVNGKLFEEHLSFASFDSGMRKILLDCCGLNWSRISPAIFGSLFQSVMDEKARRNLGAHYTSEKNILKLIKPLFLDDLWNEFESVKNNKARLQKLHDKISSLRFLDPACGCGNFLIIAYRELRLLEIEIIKRLLKLQGYREEVMREAKMDADYLIKCNVDQFYGIEYEEFPAQIARTAMWLMDHQMNMLVTETFGEYFARLPLMKAASIVQGNALRIDWQSLLIKDSTVSIHADKANIILNEPEEVYKTVNVYAKEVEFKKTGEVQPTNDIKYDYILGNPPFVGYSLQNQEQKDDLDIVFKSVNGAGVMDYVCAWYIKASQYIQKMNSLQENESSKTKAAFVSTNSISQGEQVGILWDELFNKYKVKIHFAHRTFKWSNEAKGAAAVHVVIIGFSDYDIINKKLYEYEDIKAEPHEISVRNINPYLVEGKDEFVVKRTNPICKSPQMFKGSQPTDGGSFLFTDEEKIHFLKKEPKAKKYIKPFISAHEFLNGEKRWCLWLVDADPSELRAMPLVLTRIEEVKQMRLKSSKQATVKWAQFPTLFTENRQPSTNYILIPSHSSENRTYIPMGFMTRNDILNNSCFSVPSASLYEFGVLSSVIHMIWVEYTCGRIKSDFRYSNTLNYNNFPWPENPTEKQKQAVEAAAQAVLDVRKQFMEPQKTEAPKVSPSGGPARLSHSGGDLEGASLADLYDPNTMPPALVKAHQQLDKAVDLCYRPQPFINETKRIEFLFELYDRYTAGLFTKEKKGRKKAL